MIQLGGPILNTFLKLCSLRVVSACI